MDNYWWCVPFLELADIILAGTCIETGWNSRKWWECIGDQELCWWGIRSFSRNFPACTTFLIRFRSGLGCGQEKKMECDVFLCLYCELSPLFGQLHLLLTLREQTTALTSLDQRYKGGNSPILIVIIKSVNFTQLQNKNKKLSHQLRRDNRHYAES